MTNTPALRPVPAAPFDVAGAYSCPCGSTIDLFDFTFLDSVGAFVCGSPFEGRSGCGRVAPFGVSFEPDPF